MPITLTKDWGGHPEGTTFSVIGEFDEDRWFVDQKRAKQLIKDKFAVEGTSIEPKPKAEKKARMKRG